MSEKKYLVLRPPTDKIVAGQSDGSDIKVECDLQQWRDATFAQYATLADRQYESQPAHVGMLFRHSVKGGYRIRCRSN